MNPEDNRWLSDYFSKSPFGWNGLIGFVKSEGSQVVISRIQSTPTVSPGYVSPGISVDPHIHIMKTGASGNYWDFMKTVPLRRSTSF